MKIIKIGNCILSILAYLMAILSAIRGDTALMSLYCAEGCIFSQLNLLHNK